MAPLLERPHLLDAVRRRHELSLVVLQAHPGHGLTTLLSQAMAEGPVVPGARDVLLRCRSDHARPGRLAADLVELLEPARPGRAQGPAGHDDRLVSALSRCRHPVAILLDDFHVTGTTGAELCSTVLDRCPGQVHLVLCGHRMPPIGVARLVASGAALHVGPDEFRFRPHEIRRLFDLHGGDEPAHPELASWPALASLLVTERADLVVPYLREHVLPEVPPALAEVLAITAAAGGCPADRLASLVASTLDGGDAPAGTGDGWTGGIDVATLLDAMDEIPLVEVADGCWPHPVWREATAPLLPPVATSRVLVARVQDEQSPAVLGEVGRIAVANRDRRALVAVVRAALGAEPPRASLPDLRAWRASGLLAPGSAEDAWLAGVISMRTGDPDAYGAEELERARSRFEAGGDVPGEVGVLLHAGTLARRHDDLATLGHLLARAEILARRGNPTAQALAALGRAVTAQMAGDPLAALEALDAVPAGTLSGDWVAQVLMVRGTNLLLAGRITEAVHVLDVAGGAGSGASRSVACELLATARWAGDDRAGAIDDARLSVALAERHSAPAQLRLRRAALACMLAADGQLAESDAELRRTGDGDPPLAGEAAALAELARILALLDGGAVDRARARLVALGPAPSRPTRSTMWRASLESAMVTGRRARWLDAARAFDGLRPAVDAGLAGAAALRDATPAPAAHRPWLPAAWCEPRPARCRVRLLGTCEVLGPSGPSTHRAWTRPRVRELCLHLALVADRGRPGVAADLWPHLSERAAAANLRVTLSYLLDVLDPERARGTGGVLLLESANRLTFDRTKHLDVDLWEAQQRAAAILAADRDESVAIVAHARRLVDVPIGPVMGGSPCGEWADSYRQELETTLVAAGLRAGAHALDAGDPALAEQLGRTVLGLDRWSESARRLIIEARSATGDTDGARRALSDLVGVLRELGAKPSPAVHALARRTGLATRPGPLGLLALPSRH